MAVDGLTSTLTLQLDFDKSLKTHKVPAQDAYYSARVRTHLLGIYCANNEKIYCLFYDETTGTTGPNKVISLLDYLSNRLQNELGRHDHLIIWPDNAPGQFKECYLFFYLDYIVWLGQFLRADFKFYWRVTPTLFVIDDLELYKRYLKNVKSLPSLDSARPFWRKVIYQMWKFAG